MHQQKENYEANSLRKSWDTSNCTLIHSHIHSFTDKLSHLVKFVTNLWIIFSSSRHNKASDSHNHSMRFEYFHSLKSSGNPLDLPYEWSPLTDLIVEIVTDRAETRAKLLSPLASPAKWSKQSRWLMDILKHLVI